MSKEKYRVDKNTIQDLIYHQDVQGFEVLELIENNYVLDHVREDDWKAPKDFAEEEEDGISCEDAYALHNLFRYLVWPLGSVEELLLYAETKVETSLKILNSTMESLKKLIVRHNAVIASNPEITRIMDDFDGMAETLKLIQITVDAAKRNHSHSHNIFHVIDSLFWKIRTKVSHHTNIFKCDYDLKEEYVDSMIYDKSEMNDDDDDDVKHRIFNEEVNCFDDGQSMESEHEDSFESLLNLNISSFPTMFDPMIDIKVEQEDFVKKEEECNEEKSCQLCEKVFSSTKTLKAHIRKFHCHEHNCSKCSKTFSSFEDYREHRKAEELTCKKCAKTFETKQSKKDHERAEHAEKLYLCPDCGKQFTDKKFFNAHKHYYHKVREAHMAAKVTCEICGKKYLSREKLEAHFLSVHTKVKPENYKFECDICKKRFKAKHICDKHKAAVHEGKYVGICHLCGMKFSQKGAVAKHIKGVHLRIKNCHCEICGSSFTYQNELVKHVKEVHEGRKDYKCSVCGKDFSQRHNLRVHMRTVHSGILHYPCGACDKQFISKESYQLHNRNEHQQRV